MLSVLNYLSAFSILLPIGAAGSRYQNLNQVLRRLAWFFFLSGLFDVVLAITNHFVIRNLPLFHLFTAVNLLFLAALYYHTLHGKLVRRLVLVAAAAGLVFVGYNAFFLEGIWQFPSLSITGQSLLFIVLALVYFYQLLQEPAEVPIEKQPLFWINAGVLLYFSGNLFLFMLQNWLNRMPQPNYNSYWAIHSVVNILANLLYAVGLLCKPQRLT
ncbi:hypothetical protein [Hymenobacter weizhouensis]|uniref:hypothetical protein n=1 Tax=Hymenobacter sp. YIM 151500-1 TaxID=2987689 RepID=UPI002226094D|nr:hypothetical protein [Hymenobacter sp. YIM 151500-1]UYZ62108.1 hypothetical protein OIS53_13965 [Hymenobacter sp. YIM 151500-1]